MLQTYIQILQLQTSPDEFLMFLIQVKTVLLLLTTPGVLLQSMLPLNNIKSVLKDIVNALENVIISSILKL